MALDSNTKLKCKDEGVVDNERKSNETHTKNLHLKPNNSQKVGSDLKRLEETYKLTLQLEREHAHAPKIDIIKNIFASTNVPT